MGTFVLGILVGWLAEWLFFTFWVKGKSEGSGNAENKNLKDEISILKSKLAKAEADKKSTSSTGGSAVSSTTAAATAKSSASTVKSTTKSKEKKSAENKKAPIKKAANKATTTKKSPAKPASKKASPKTAVKKPSVKSAPKTKNTTADAKTTAAKTETRKITAKKQVTSKKASVTKKPTTTRTATGDDLTKLSGIGPSMASTLMELGIDSYPKLAAMDDDILRDMLEASGARLNNNKEAMDSWNEQATLAAKGDFDGLKKLQDAIK